MRIYLQRNNALAVWSKLCFGEAAFNACRFVEQTVFVFRQDACHRYGIRYGIGKQRSGRIKIGDEGNQFVQPDVKPAIIPSLPRKVAAISYL